jgi:hypothetical protein
MDKDQNSEMKQGSPFRWVRWLVLLSLTASIFLLLAGMFFEASKDARLVWKVLAYPAVWRGARFGVSEEFANYLSFLETVIPPGAILGIPPPGSSHWALANTPYMRYYLAPRQVVNCTLNNVGCAADLAGKGAFLVVLGNGQFPPAGDWSNQGSVIMFNLKWGVWVPKGSEGLRPEMMSPVLIPLKRVFFQGWLGLTALLVMSAAGAGFLGYWLPGLSLVSRLALGFGLGVGWLVLSLYLVLLTGARLNPVVISTVVFAWLLLGGIYGYLTLRRWQAQGSVGPLIWRYLCKAGVLWYLPFLALALAAAFLAVGQGYHSSDEIFIWGAKGTGIALEGLPRGVTDWGTQTTQYPLLVPVWIAAVRAGTGDLVSQSKLIFPFFYLGMLLGMAEFLNLKLPRLASLLVCLGLAVTPLVLRHAGLAYANLPLTYFLVCGALLIAGQFAQVTGESQPPSQGVLVLSSIFLGLAAWTRPEGTVLSLLVIGSALWVFRKSWLPRDWRHNTLLLLLPWLVLVLMKIPQGLLAPAGRLGLLVLLEKGVQALRAGDWHPAELAYLLAFLAKGVVDLHSWGVLLIGLTVFFCLGLTAGRRERDVQFLILAGGLSGLSILGLYYLLSFDGGHDIRWWATTGLNRMLLPSIVLLWVAAACHLTTLFPPGDRQPSIRPGRKENSHVPAPG